MNVKDLEICTQSDMAGMVRVYGFLPFFRNVVPGFSVEEHTPPELWFSDYADGPWEWKGPVIRETGCAYGKFFHGKAGFISPAWFLDFANYRRDGYDLDARYEDGLIGYQEKAVYEALQERDSLLSKEWRRLTGIKKRSEFDSAVGRLQMLGYVVTADFEYAVAKDGSLYGWGLARYATPERFFGADFSDHIYDRSPEDSKRRMLEHLHTILPQATEKQLTYIIG